MITSANIACGGHTGDETSMREAVVAAQQHGVAIGAHPSYADRENFGRKRIDIGTSALLESLRRQLETLQEIAAAAGATLTHVKPHGALYNDAHADATLARSVIGAISAVGGDVAIVCGRSSAIYREATRRGMRAIAEGFADRRYQSDGALVSRSRSDSLLLDPAEAAAQALEIVNHERVIADDGTVVTLDAETLCIHSDMIDSPKRLRAIRDALAASGVTFKSPHI